MLQLSGAEEDTGMMEDDGASSTRLGYPKVYNAQH